MKHKKKRKTRILKELALFVVLFIMIPIKANANDKDGKLTNHVIIAFDDALPGPYKDKLCLDGERVCGVIQQIIDSCNLLNEGDYYSVLNYCMGTNNCLWEDFVQPSILQSFYDDNGIALWCPFSSNNSLLPKEINDWKSVVYEQGKNRVQGEPFSLQTGAKHFVLKAVKSNRNRTNRVFLLMVTDNQYNGNDDINKEMEKYKKDRHGCAPEDVFINKCREVNDYFRFVNLYEKVLAILQDSKYKVMLFEVIPCFSTSLNSVIDYPASMGLHRVKGGYNICFDYRGVDSMFHVEKLVFTVKKDNEVICIQTNNRGDGNINLKLDEVFPGDDIDVEMSCWLSMEDPVYNGILMSPDDERYSRLKTSKKIMLTDHASVFGFPLDDGVWWFSHDDSDMAALIWEVIIVVTIVVIVLVTVILVIRLLIKRASKFNFDDASIEINTI